MRKGKKKKFHTISSPGRTESTRSPNNRTSLVRGNLPGGTEPGDSCKVTF
jgi:hypothetical protein